MYKKNAVIILDGENSHGLNVITCLSENKTINIYVISKIKYPAIRFSRYCKFFYYVNNENEKLALILEIAQKNEKTILMPVTEPGVKFIYNYRERLEGYDIIFSVPNEESFDIARDKFLLSQFCQKKGILHPNTFLFAEEIYEEIDDSFFPFLIKPIKGEGGEGIKLLKNKSELLSEVKNINENSYILQHFIKGYDIDCSVLCKEGEILVYTIQKSLTKGSDFIPASGICFLFNLEVLSIVKKLMFELKWNGIAHIDLRYDEKEGRINIIEINPRFWASLLGSLSMGINFPYYSLLSIQGIDIIPKTYKQNLYMSSFLYLKTLFRLFWIGQCNKFKISTSLKYFIKDPLPLISILIKRYFNFLLKIIYTANDKKSLCLKSELS